MRDWTSKELASHLNIEPLVAYGFIKFMESKGLVTLSGKRKAKGTGRGKPENLYSFADNADVSLSDLMKALSVQERPVSAKVAQEENK